jgi:hypothetical protein
MLIIVIAGLATCGGAVFTVLDRPVARDKHRNEALSVALLAFSSAGLLAGLAYAVTSGLLR